MLKAAREKLLQETMRSQAVFSEDVGGVLHEHINIIVPDNLGLEQLPN